MGKQWQDCTILGCDAETLAETLPNGLRGRPQKTLDSTPLDLCLRLPEKPHPYHEAFWKWVEDQGIDKQMIMIT